MTTTRTIEATPTANGVHVVRVGTPDPASGQSTTTACRYATSLPSTAP